VNFPNWIALTLFEDIGIGAAIAIAAIFAWRGIKVIIVRRENGK